MSQKKLSILEKILHFGVLGFQRPAMRNNRLFQAPIQLWGIKRKATIRITWQWWLQPSRHILNFLNFAENSSSGDLRYCDRGEANGVEVLNYVPAVVNRYHHCRQSFFTRTWKL